MKQGIIFNMQRYSLDDGPGIRTVVFLKGCPMRCRWCANPESQQMQPQIMIDQSLCRSCGSCVQVCPNGCAQGCIACGQCADACWYSARRLCGERISADRIVQLALRDADYFRQSGGGVTLSGGEPLLQSEFAAEILRLLRAESIHTAIETAGHVPWASIQNALPHLNLIYFDCKHVDTDRHRSYTGVGNELILENLERLLAAFENVVVRIPCIPGFNQSESDLDSILAKLKKIGAQRVELLPFHRFGSGKYRELGARYAYEDIPPLKADDLAYAAALGEKYALNLTIHERRS